MSAGHLARRFIKSLSRRPPPPRDEAWAHTWLSAEEIALWAAMANPDRRHAVEVGRRFRRPRPAATRAEMAGAVLHDVGKVQSGLGTLGRVVATIVGARNRRFSEYRDHGQIGAEMAARCGSDPATVALISGDGPAAADLRDADDSI